MKAEAYLVDYKALHTFPLDLETVLRTYGLTTQKSMLSKFTIKTKILPIMQQRADKNLTIPTLYFMLDAARQVVNDVSRVYVPVVGKEEILECVLVAITHFPVETSPEIMRDLIVMIKDIISLLDKVVDKSIKSFSVDCSDAFSEVKSQLVKQEEVAIGYALSARNDNHVIPVANAYMSNLPGNTMDIGKTDDLRQIVFVDPFGEDSVATVDMIGNLAGNAIALIHDKNVEHGILEGANVLSNDIFEQVMSYLVEVRCAASNVCAAKELCEQTNYDLECSLFENVTLSEDCVADVSGHWFGWSDDTVICKGNGDDANELKLSDIFSQPQISGKNIQYVLGSIAVEKDAEKRKFLVEKLKNSVVETFKWEGTQESFSDFPILHFIGRTTQIMETLTKNTVYYNRICEAVSSLNEGIVSALEDGGPVACTFNPCPTINSITPINARASQVAFNNVFRAETDEDMDNAMLEFAKCYENAEHLEESWSLTLRNLGRIIANLKEDAINTGRFEPVEKRLLEIVNSCKTVDDVRYLQKDASMTQSLRIKAERIKKIENGETSGMDQKTLKNLESQIKKGLSSKSIEDHLDWIDKVYKPTLSKKMKEIKQVVTESNAISKGARNASRKIQKGTEKAIRNVGGTAHEVKQAAHNAVDPMERYIGQMMDKLKKADSAKRREVLVKGGTMPKVLRWVKRSIPLIAGAAAGSVVPAAAVIAGISLIGFIASDKILDAKEKRKILREIEDEIEIVNEKIDDSRGDTNKQKKYELIRIRNNLKRTQNRILYNLKE